MKVGDRGFFLALGIMLGCSLPREDVWAPACTMAKFLQGAGSGGVGQVLLADLAQRPILTLSLLHLLERGDVVRVSGILGRLAEQIACSTSSSS